MSAKTSTTTTAATTTPLIVKVKKEPGSDEIKDFAETAMNELLGWYGYDNVDRNDLARCASRAGPPNHSSTQPQSLSASSNVVPSLTVSLVPEKRTIITTDRRATNHSVVLHSTMSSATVALSSLQSSGGHTTDRGTNNSSPDSLSRLSHSPPMCVMTTGPAAVAAVGNAHGAGGDEKNAEVECGWCKRSVSLGSPEFLASPEGPRYCTESCFSQSRRASFKRAKTCDWCKHVRHAVSYVDFQDGASQLQFCSDKCLNQYKMQIFCRETQAHLDQHPHLKDKGKGGNEGSLITPDLWLRNCKSRSASPASDRSRSRSPTVAATPPPHRPIITLAPSSKLLSRPHPVVPHSPRASPLPTTTATQPTRVSQRVTRKRRSLRIVNSVAMPRNDRSPSAVKMPPLNGHQTAPAVVSTPQPTLQDLTTNAQHRNISTRLLPAKEAVVQPPSSASMPNYHQFLSPAQNLYAMRTLPTSGTTASTQFAQRPNVAYGHQSSAIVGGTIQTPHYASASLLNPQHQAHASSTLPGNHTPFPANAANNTPPTVEPTPPPQGRGLFGAPTAPPITILVPYPILVPVPIPIPIPMPILAFLRAAQLKLDADNNNQRPEEKRTTEAEVTRSADDARRQTDVVSDEQPLDCTKTRDLCPEDDPEQLIEVVCDDDESPKGSGDEADAAAVTIVAGGDAERSNHRAVMVEPAAEQNEPLPKFKITRLNSRRGFITSSSSSTNPSNSQMDPISVVVHTLSTTNRTQSSPNVVGVMGAASSTSRPSEQPHHEIQQHVVVPTKETAASAMPPASSTPPSSCETSRPLRKRKRVMDFRFKDDERKRNPSISGGAQN